MIGLVRAVTLCAALALGLSAAQAADKAFKRDDLADSSIKLEAQIKSEAGPVAKTNATLRTDADAAFRRNDYRTGLSVLGQIAATTPEDAGNWLRLAKVIVALESGVRIRAQRRAGLGDRPRLALDLRLQLDRGIGEIVPLERLVGGGRRTEAERQRGADCDGANQTDHEGLPEITANAAGA